MKTLVIKENDAGRRLDKFLAAALPLLPKSMMYKYIRLKRIKLNGKRCEISTRLSLGDIVQCYVSDEFFEAEEKRPEFMLAPSDVSVVYEDENTFTIFVEDDQVAPYMPYTNEPWISPKWNGKKNPNEAWWQDAVKLVREYLKGKLQ